MTETISWDLRKCGSASQSINRQTESSDEFSFFGRENYGGKIEISKPEDFLPETKTDAKSWEISSVTNFRN